jgi:hypothetical protein
MTITGMLLTILSISCFAQEPTHGRDPAPCDPRSEQYLVCAKCPQEEFTGNFTPITVPELLKLRDPGKKTFYMFITSNCPHFPQTMPPYIWSVTHMDSIHPVLVIVDTHRELPLVRKRITAWGWTGPVFVLDQDHYGCFEDDFRERNEQVLREFGIEEEKYYGLTVTLEFLVDPNGHVTGYSNWNDLPNRLRGKNLPQY